MNIKKKHHFVSQFYLKRWGVGVNDKIFSWDGEKFLEGSVRDTGHQNHLYRITPLSENQIKFFEDFVKSQKMDNLSTYTLIITQIFEQFHLIRRLELVSDLTGEKPSEEVDTEIKKFYSNFLEDKFSYDEGVFSKIITEIEEDIKTEFTLKDYDILMNFIVFQLVKTPKKINNLMEINRNEQVIESLNFTDNQLSTFTVLLNLCYLEKIYMGWIGRLLKINFYKNKSDLNYFTSDDPVFNERIDENKILIRFPLSPNTLLELTENEQFNEEQRKNLVDYYNNNHEYTESIKVNGNLVNLLNMPKDEVIDVNQKIFDNRNRVIYVKDKKDIMYLK